MDVAMLTLCAALYCPPEQAEISKVPQAMQSTPVIRMAAKKCPTLNKTQCKTNKNCVWRTKVARCVGK